MKKYVHALQPDRRCPERFSLGAATFTTLWAYSEGMRIFGGRLYVVDSALMFLSAMIYALFTWIAPTSVAISVGMSVFLAGRVGIGFLAPRYLKQYLNMLGYRLAS